MSEINFTENQTFSFPRFWQLLKSDMRIYKPKYLRIVIAAIGCFLSAAIIISIFAVKAYQELEIDPINASYPDKTEELRLYVGYYYLISLFILSVGMTILGSLTFSSMSSKSGRIATLMMPASMAEKFLLRFFIYFIGGILLLVVGFYIGYLELFITLPIKEALIMEIKVPVANMPTFMKIIMVMTVFVVLNYLLAYSFYTLGSALWPRTSWLKTWVVQQVLGILSFIIGLLGFWHYLPEFIRTYVEGVVDGEPLFWVVVGAGLLLVICLWALAWWRFKTTQIVQRFMNR